MALGAFLLDEACAAFVPGVFQWFHKIPCSIAYDQKGLEQYI